MVRFDTDKVQQKGQQSWGSLPAAWTDGPYGSCEWHLSWPTCYAEEHTGENQAGKDEGALGKSSHYRWAVTAAGLPGAPGLPNTVLGS